MLRPAGGMNMESEKNQYLHFNGSLVDEINLSHLTDHQFLPDLAKQILHDKKHEKFDLRCFALKNSHLDEEGYDALYQMLSQCEHLEHVYLSDNHFDAAHAAHFTALLPKDHLNYFVFADNWIDDEYAGSFFNALTQQSKIQTLDLSSNWLGDTGIPLMVNVLQHNQGLRHLNLSCNDLHANALDDLVEFFKHAHIHSLDVSYNFLGAKGMAAIQKIILYHNCPKKLNLRTNHIGNEGAGLIAHSLRKNHALEALDLSDNEMTIQGVRQIVDSALEQEQLTYLNLAYNTLHEREKKQIKQLISLSLKNIELII